MASTMTGGRGSKPKPAPKKTFTATVTTEKQQRINTRTNTASFSQKAKPESKMAKGMGNFAKATAADPTLKNKAAKPAKPTMFKGKKVTPLPKKVK